MAGDHETELPDDTEGGPVKSFLEHLEDFRWVLIKSLATLGLAMLVCLLGANFLIQVLKWPLTRAHVHYRASDQVAIVSFGTNHLGNFVLSPEQQKNFNLSSNQFVAVQIEPLLIGTNQVLGWHENPDPAAIAEAQRMHIELINLSPAGAFIVAVQVALYGGLVLAALPISIFIAMFVFPALKLHERRHIYPALFFAGGLFFVGVSFCYFILLPLALAASQMYANWMGFSSFQWRAEEYISFVCKFMLGMGLGFELPVVILTLVKIGVLSYETLAKARRYMIVINLILGAVLTTPEVITQITMFIPLQLLYEVTVWVAWYWDRKERKKAASQ
jgi:sec-independent protein translocase protein TatC